MKIKKENLLLIAGLVWLIAGFNLLKIGILAYQSNVSLIHILISTLIFLVFWFMVFYPLTKKHVKRILGYQEKQYFWLFFDVQSFLIMAFMMSLGISIRRFRLLPDVFIAVFYTGLGFALFLAGILFNKHFIQQILSLRRMNK